MSDLMLALLLGGAALAVLVLELWSGKRWADWVSFRIRMDMTLTEPGEEAELSFRLCNTGFLPLFTVSLTFHFEEGVALRGAEANPAENTRTLETALLPHRVLWHSIPLSFRTRGVHSLGKVYIETRSLLGLRSRVRSLDLPHRVICTAKPLNRVPALEVLGGVLGDISVRRFLLEDPSLVLGYRDYTGREAMRRISWTQTARTGRLTVKNHDFTVDADVAVLVDLEDCAGAVGERCLRLVRTVCDALERRQIPYVLRSNGDLNSTRRGVGRLHSFEIQRRIGLSRLVRYWSFDGLLARCAAEGNMRGYLVIAPRRTPALQAGLRRLQAVSPSRICLLTGEEVEDE